MKNKNKKSTCFKRFTCFEVLVEIMLASRSSWSKIMALRFMLVRVVLIGHLKK